MLLGNDQNSLCYSQATLHMDPFSLPPQDAIVYGQFGSYQHQRANLSSLFQVPQRLSTESSTGDPLLDIKCPFCQKSFAHKSSMCRHKMMCKKNNNPKEKLSCGVCLKTFSQRWMLQKHIAEADCHQS